jgi:SAM-dependent methyltransferase
LHAGARFFSALASGFRRAARVCEVVAAAAHSREELRAGIAREWDDFRQDREEVLRGLFDWEREVLDHALSPECRVLLAGCGTGRELLALAREGYRVTGVDPSAAAIETARRLSVGLPASPTLVHGFIEDAAVPDTFDAIVFTHRAYGLIQGRSFRIAALEKVARLLRPGGRVVVSALQGGGLSPALRRAARLGAWLASSGLAVEPGDDLYWIGGPAPAFGYEHHFTEEELSEEFTAAGLSVRQRWPGPCLSAVLAPAGAGSPTVSATAQGPV